jgi:L-cysteine S-thiosulfotransferase
VTGGVGQERGSVSGGGFIPPPHRLGKAGMPRSDGGRSRLFSARIGGWLIAVAFLAASTGAKAELRAFSILGDGIPASLTGQPGDPGRGRAIIVNRQVGLCLLCHTGPFPEERFQGSLAPDLRGAGSRWSEAQLRLRLVDSSRLNRDTIMPSYYRIDHLTRVGRAWQDKPVLSAEEIEDVISFLTTLGD